MNDNRDLPNIAPRWLLVTERIMEEIDRDICGIESKLRRASDQKELDPRVKNEMRYLGDALDVVKISLSMVDVAARDVLSDSTAPDQKPQRAVVPDR